MRGTESRAIALERPEVREQPVRPGDGDGPLQVRVRRHQRRLEARGLFHHRALQTAERAVELLADVDRPEPGSRRHLIVPTAARVKLRGDVTDLLVQQAIDQRVHVLVRRLRLLAALQSDRHGFEARLDRLAFFQREHASAPERNRPRLGQTDIVGPEAEVDANGVVERVELRRRARTEPPAPQLVRSGLDSSRRRGPHFDIHATLGLRVAAQTPARTGDGAVGSDG